MSKLIAMVVMVLCSGCGIDCDVRGKCRANAHRRGKVELKCADVRAEHSGSDNVMVYGCGKSIVYECYGGTPEKEGSRALRQSGD